MGAHGEKRGLGLVCTGTKAAVCAVERQQARTRVCGRTGPDAPPAAPRLPFQSCLACACLLGTRYTTVLPSLVRM